MCSCNRPKKDVDNIEHGEEIKSSKENLNESYLQKGIASLTQYLFFYCSNLNINEMSILYGL